MSHKITYTSKWSGREVVKNHTGTKGDAIGWTKSLAEDNGCKATCVEVADGPYDYNGKTKHVVSYGDKE